LQGLSVFAAVAGVFVWSVLGHRSDETVRSIAFTTLVLGNLLLILVNRSWRLSIWRSLAERRNPTLKWILALTIALLTVLLTAPGPRRAFSLGVVNMRDALVCVVASALGVSWFEVYKRRHS
jgi:P-type Ca2+ transporter type 2C